MGTMAYRIVKLLIGFCVVKHMPTAIAQPIDWVTVGDEGNAPDPLTSFGAVDYEYRFGKFEITIEQYLKFLNAVGAADAHGIYAPLMSGFRGGVTREGEPGSYTYIPRRPHFAPLPMPHINYWRAVRFANWLHNGKPSGSQDASTTEDGAYTLTADAISKKTVSRNPDARFFVPSEDEWYKAAYYKGGGLDSGYWQYATQSDEEPIAEAPPGGENSANWDDKVGGISLGGAYINSPGPYGTFDQAGNLWEWTEKVTGDDRQYRVIRGASFLEDDFLAPQFRAFGEPTATFGTIGLRLASIVPPICDFDDDFTCSVSDIDLLIASTGTSNPLFNLDATNNVIDEADRDAWLEEAGTLQFGSAFNLGDANLDGTVDALDLNELGKNWLREDSVGWSGGDFNGDRMVDQLDLNVLGRSWQSHIRPSSALVPEPRPGMYVWGVLVFVLFRQNEGRVRFGSL